MIPLRHTPCQRFGVSPSGEPFPCLQAGWGDHQCPASAACGKWLRECQAEMYKRGFPYSSWVVRDRAFGLCTECTLQFSSEQPTPRNAEELFGSRVLHVSPAG